jgi:prefoldin subunit 5
MIEANQGRIKRIRQVVKEIKDEIRQLRAQLETLNKTTLANSFLETTEYLK